MISLVADVPDAFELTQQRLEPRLPEVLVACKSGVDGLILHDNEADAVREGPVMVWTQADKFSYLRQELR